MALGDEWAEQQALAWVSEWPEAQVARLEAKAAK